LHSFGRIQSIAGMKYTSEVTIALPKDRVVELFSDPENMYEWMEGLNSMEAISGEPGKAGSKTSMKFEMGNRKIDMVETLVENGLPDFWHAIYETKGVWNEQKNFFKPVDDQTSKWISESEFRFSGIMKLMSILFKGAFKKQSIKIMNDFKKFAERQYEV
jgi:uncharacterized membrane protein